MPNWCQNRLEIDGPNEAIAKIIKACRLQEGEFDLNSIVPMPPELDITSGSAVSWGIDILYGDWQRVFGLPWLRDLLLEITGGYLPETRDDLIRLIETESFMYGAAHRRSLDFISLREARQAKANLERFGFKDWYDWRVANWGTKWNVGKDVDIDSLSECNITLTFDTAWSPPVPVAAALCSQYPEISATLRFIETESFMYGAAHRRSLDFISLREARQAKANLERFGFKDWYDWRVANWGTKWNVGKDVDIDSLSECNITLTFDTAWSPPVPVAAALCSQYPEISATLRFIETGCWFAGTVEGIDGEIKEYPADDVRAFGEDFFGMEFDDEKDETEEEEAAA